MREKILTFIEKNSRIDTQELAVILGVDETAVMNELEAMEQEGIICGYHTLINWDKAGVEKVTALIEVRVTPQRGMDQVLSTKTNFILKKYKDHGTVMAPKAKDERIMMA